MSNRNDEQKEDSKNAIKREKDKTLKLLDTSQVKDETLDEGKVRDVSEDVEPSSFTENAPDTSYGADTKGSPEVDKSTRSKRFAIEHEEIVDKDSLLLKQIKKVTDKPSD